MQFYKYQANGNDFIMLDGIGSNIETDNYVALFETICHRRFGIGADGVIVIKKNEHSDFEMIYYNADGKIGSMCGNGGQAATHFAKHLNLFEGNKTQFVAADGCHQASLNPDETISLNMQNIDTIEPQLNGFFLNTGSPHHVQFVENLADYDVFEQGKIIRNGILYKEKGTNVNFIETINPNLTHIRTYERGVENETYSCGTGTVAAAAVQSFVLNQKNPQTIKNQIHHFKTKGGKLSVSLTNIGNQSFENIILTGKAQKVFEGII